MYLNNASCSCEEHRHNHQHQYHHHHGPSPASPIIASYIPNPTLGVLLSSLHDHTYPFDMARPSLTNICSLFVASHNLTCLSLAERNRRPCSFSSLLLLYPFPSSPLLCLPFPWVDILLTAATVTTQQMVRTESIWKGDVYQNVTLAFDPRIVKSTVLLTRTTTMI